jgi:hypothetical protein
LTEPDEPRVGSGALPDLLRGQVLRLAVTAVYEPELPVAVHAVRAGRDLRAPLTLEKTCEVEDRGFESRRVVNIFQICNAVCGVCVILIFSPFRISLRPVLIFIFIFL